MSEQSATREEEVLISSPNSLATHTSAEFNVRQHYRSDMDSGDTPNPPGSDPPPPRKRKNVVLPKKKRRFTRTLKDEKPATAEEEETAVAEPAEPAKVGSVLARAHSQGAARRLTRQELTAEVKRLNEELLAAQEVTKSLQRENSSLQKRNKTLSESHTKARQDLREERKVASKQEQINKRKWMNWRGGC